MFYTSGNFAPFVPKQIQQLPFDLLRSSLVVRDPETIQAALEQERAGAPNPVMVPQRMGMTRWLDTSGFAQNVEGMLRALAQTDERVSSIQDAVREAPYNDVERASHADGRNAMPRLSAELSSNIAQSPVSRGVIPWDRLPSVDELNALSASRLPAVGDGAATRAAMASAQGLGRASLGDVATTLNPVPPDAWIRPVALILTGAAVGYAVGLPVKGGIRDRNWGGAIGALMGSAVNLLMAK